MNLFIIGIEFYVSYLVRRLRRRCDNNIAPCRFSDTAGVYGFQTYFVCAADLKLIGNTKCYIAALCTVSRAFPYLLSVFVQIIRVVFYGIQIICYLRTAVVLRRFCIIYRYRICNQRENIHIRFSRKSRFCHRA